jgi:hypothetical protein
MNDARPSKLTEEEHYCQDQQSFESAIDETNDIHLRHIALAIELGCWVVVSLAPMLRFIDGWAVTHDQFIVQSINILFGNSIGRHQPAALPTLFQ